MGAKGFVTACPHVERKHYAHGLCEPCDKKRRRRLDPDWHRREAARREAQGQSEGERSRAYRYRVVYGITEADYDAMHRAQLGACAICHVVPVRRLNVDHDHTTGVVRGLLCSNCNTAVGLMADDPGRLRAAIAYLERN